MLDCLVLGDFSIRDLVMSYDDYFDDITEREMSLLMRNW